MGLMRLPIRQSFARMNAWCNLGMRVFAMDAMTARIQPVHHAGVGCMDGNRPQMHPSNASGGCTNASFECLSYGMVRTVALAKCRQFHVVSMQTYYGFIACECLRKPTPSIMRSFLCA